MRGFKEFAGRFTRLVYNKDLGLFVFEEVQHAFPAPHQADRDTKAAPAADELPQTTQVEKARGPDGGRNDR